ncbi:MAG: dihydrolipoyl dehydrogenase [Chloroflexi bacterium]|nr:dihydrolipoyl dehydrogenase [Chloroflexota bacterium]
MESAPVTDQPSFDLAILGAGPGGYVAAIRAAQLGAKVALIERDQLGGTCLHRGCIPTKTLLHSVEVLQQAKHWDELGLEAGPVSANLPKMIARKRAVVAEINKGLETLMRSHRIQVIRGEGRLLSSQLLAVRQPQGDEQTIAARRIIIATGSTPARLPIPGASHPRVITSDEALELEQAPANIVIIGGGVVGEEMATLFHGLGAKVTILELLPTILSEADEGIAGRYTQILRRRGVDVRVSASVREIIPTEGKLTVRFETTRGAATVAGELVLLATGRQPCTPGIGLEGIGIQMEGGFVAVDERMQTNVDGVYAIGDIVKGPMLAHRASHQGLVAAENALGGNRLADDRAVPSAIYSSPEIAWVGLTEREAREQGYAYRVGRFPFTANSRALTLGETEGLVKVISEEGSGKVLGVHMLGPRVTDLIAEAALAVKLGATVQDLAETIHAHPTLPEALHEAALDSLGRAIHIFHPR